MMYQDVLDKIVDNCKEIFGADLTGVYLHGSLAMGCFNPDKSDLDLIIVIEKDILDKQKLEFMNELTELNKKAPGKGIELSIVKKVYCREFLYPTPFELHFSNMHLQWFIENPADYISNMKGTDKDLAAHFTIIKKYGIVLYGQEINEVFADVPEKDYLDSIWCDVEGAEENILEDPVYTILNLCRVAAFCKSNLITSKKQGGEWALQNFASKYQFLISSALQNYTLGRAMQVNEKEIKEFADDMLQFIRKMMTDV